MVKFIRVQRRSNLDDLGLGIIHRDAAGIDVGNESHFVSLPPDRDPAAHSRIWLVDWGARRNDTLAQELWHLHGGDSLRFTLHLTWSVRDILEP